MYLRLCRFIIKKIFLILIILATLLSQDSYKDSLNQQSIELSELDVDLYLYDSYLEEAKMFFSDFVIADMTSDTSNALYGLKQLYETLSIINSLEGKDEIQQLEFNKILSASLDYFQHNSLTLNNIETGISVAILRDRLDDYIYEQTLEDLEFVDEQVEIIPGHVPITYNSKVKNVIKFFQNDGRSSMKKWLNRMDRYKKIILPILDKENVPPELFYLAMIESGLNPRAYSYAHAAGVWQFILSTGKIYGMNKDYWIDERRDFEKSTIAASKYLSSLYKKYGDWYLAFAAYNCGSKRVDKAIRIHNSRNYWDLNSLPRQTRNYVPNIMAALFISKDPEKYGFVVKPISDLEWYVVEIDKSYKLSDIASCAGINVQIVKDYNPELRQDRIPPLEKGQSYKMRLPINTNKNFDTLLSNIIVEKIEKTVFVDHKVKYGESLWIIARKYGVSLKAITEVNKIRNPRLIKPGQVLRIPNKTGTNTTNTKKIVYVVKRGDTLSEIAQKHKTSVSKIKKWNGIRNSNKIRIGQRLYIYKN